MKKLVVLFPLLLMPWHLFSATITVTSPVSTSIWRLESRHDIRWTHSGFANPASQSVNIRLRRGSTIVCDIATSVPLTAGVCSWTLSAAACPGLVPGRYSVRVRIPGGTVGDSPEFTVAERYPVVQAIQEETLRLEHVLEKAGQGSLRRHADGSTSVEYHTGTGPQIGSGTFGPEAEVTTTRGFVSIDLSRIPAGATIKHAHVLIDPRSVYGYPFERLGNVVAIRIQYNNVMDCPSCYDMPGPTLFVHTKNPPREYGQYDVTNPIKNLRTGGQRYFQIRLQFERDFYPGGVYDYIYIDRAPCVALQVSYTR